MTDSTTPPSGLKLVPLEPQLAAHARLQALAICDDVLPALGDPTPRVSNYSDRVQVVESALHRVRSVLSVLPVDDGRTMSGAECDVLAERQRQINKEGWSQAHDDKHQTSQMAEAAACYITGSMEWSWRDSTQRWPWSHGWWKPKGRRPNLVRAAALLIAEIERIDRAATQGAETSSGGEVS